MLWHFDAGEECGVGEWWKRGLANYTLLYPPVVPVSANPKLTLTQASVINPKLTPVSANPKVISVSANLSANPKSKLTPVEQQFVLCQGEKGCLSPAAILEVHRREHDAYLVTLALLVLAFGVAG
jgi:hypothetical protein